jgi:pyrophosphatase PpaX
MSRTRPEAVVFDLDGTLIDSIPLILESFRYTLAHHLGDVPDDATLISGIGTPLRTQLGRYCADPAVVEAMFVTYKTHNRAHHDALLRPFPEVAPAIAALAAAGLPLGIVTSKARDVALQGLERCGLSAFFPPAVVVALEDCALHKPDPAPVILGCARVGVEPGRAVYVGDSTHDLRAGRAAGARTAAVAWGPFPRADLEACAPDWFCEVPADLVRVFAGPG